MEEGGDMSQLNSQMNAQKKTILECREKIVQLQGEKNSYSGKVSSLEQEREHSKQELQNCYDLIKSVKQDNASYMATLEDNRKNISQLKRDVHEEQFRNQVTTEDSKNIQIRISELMNKNGLYEQQLQAKDAQHSALYDQLIHTISELDAIKAKYT